MAEDDDSTRCGVSFLRRFLEFAGAASSLLFELKGYDPRVIALAAAVLALVSFTAGYLPARRASAVDPVQALRYE